MQPLFGELASNPAYRHLLINHLPIIGLATGALALSISIFLRSHVARIPALVVVLLMAASALPVHRTGEQAYKAVRQGVDDAGIDWLDLHSDRADAGLPVFFVLIGLTLAALIAPFKWPHTARSLATFTVLGALACTGVGSWIAQAGGPIIHAELRPPLPTEDTEVALPTDPDPGP